MMNNNFIIPEPYLPVIAKVLPEALADNKYKDLWLKKYNNPLLRYTLLTGGRGCWKTSFLAFFCAYATSATEDHNVLLLRYTLTDAKETIANDLIEAIEHLGIADLFTINKSEGLRVINNRTNNYILIRGVKASSSNQTANVKGLNKFRSVLIDEAEEFVDEAVFDKLDNSIRREGVNNIIIAMNPAIRSHWIYKRWIKYTKKTVKLDTAKIETSTAPDVLHVHPSYFDLPKEYLSESWLANAELLKQRNQKKYNHTHLGEWVDVLEGAIFQFSTCKHIPEGNSVIGIDYGSANPTAVVLATLVENRLYIKQLWHKANTTFNERCAMIANKVSGYPNLPIVTDHDLDMKNELWNTYRVNTIFANKNVKQRLDLMVDLEIYIHEDSYEVIDEFSKYRRKPGEEKPIKKDDHSVDAAGYAFMHLFTTFGNYVHTEDQKRQRRRKARKVKQSRYNTN